MSESVARKASGLRSSMLQGQRIDWILQRSRRRSIGLQVDDRGLRVSAPRWVGVSEIEQALQRKADWILRKRAEWEALAQRRARLAPRWSHGEIIRVFDQELSLILGARRRGVAMIDDRIEVGLDRHAPAEQVAKLVEHWLRERARHHFSERVEFFCKQIGRRPRRIMLSSARTRWGSCSADGSIRLNWRLIHLPETVIDYVVVHELAHLLEMNHGPDFWAIVGGLIPDYAQARQWLRSFPSDAAIQAHRMQ